MFSVLVKNKVSASELFFLWLLRIQFRTSITTQLYNSSQLLKLDVENYMTLAFQNPSAEFILQ